MRKLIRCTDEDLQVAVIDLVTRASEDGVLAKISALEEGLKYDFLFSPEDLNTTLSQLSNKGEVKLIPKVHKSGEEALYVIDLVGLASATVVL